MATLDDGAAKYGPWAEWALRGLHELGGSATPREVEHHVAKQLEASLKPGQIARVLKNKYLRWATVNLRKDGLVGGETGTWELTASGRALAELRAKDVIATPLDIVELPPEEADWNGPTGSVDVTAFEGYEIPALRALSAGPLSKQELLAAVEAAMRASWLPGDTRLMTTGVPVWVFRASWTLSQLKKDGFARNNAKAVWEITEAGRTRLEKESATYAITSFQGASKATVRMVASQASPAGPQLAKPPAPPAGWPTDAWLALGDEIAPAILEAVARRVRPDLGPIPKLERGSVPRNVILYGPPGTGKTHVASRIAAALTGDDEASEEKSFRLVQFHPSYSYEDFVQGLRPDLKQGPLRYALHEGPFFALCKAALEDPDAFFVIVIDEINRGDPARIFGELLYALEYRGKAVGLAVDGQLVVPPNVIVIGTMNSVDRSVALVDYALRRRFAFVRLDPDPEAIRRVREDDAFSRAAAAALSGLNEWLRKRLDREHTIGHSFFLNPSLDASAPDALDGVWREDLLPLLEEYFLGDAEGLAEATKEWARLVADLSKPTA